MKLWRARIVKVAAYVLPQTLSEKCGVLAFLVAVKALEIQFCFLLLDSTKIETWTAAGDRDEKGLCQFSQMFERRPVSNWSLVISNVSRGVVARGPRRLGTERKEY
jgi:hypothetical protein